MPVRVSPGEPAPSPAEATHLALREAHSAIEALASSDGLASVDDAVAVLADEAERGDPRAGAAIRGYWRDERAVGQHEVRGPGASVRARNATSKALDLIASVVETEQAALARIDSHPFLNDAGKAQEREKLTKDGAKARAPALAELDRALGQLDERIEALRGRWPKLAAKPIEATPLDALRLDLRVGAVLAGAGPLDDERLGALMLRAAEAGDRQLAGALLRTMTVSCADPLLLRGTARAAASRMAGIARASVLDHDDRRAVAAELHALGRLRAGLVELRRDAGGALAGEPDLLRQRLAKLVADLDAK